MRRTDEDQETATQARAVAEHRRVTMDVAAARATAQASLKAGFPVPAQVQEVLDEADKTQIPAPAPQAPAEPQE